MGTLYDAIGVTPRATEGQIKAACLALGERYRPDRNRYDAEAEARFAEIEDAFRVLTDSAKRRIYDSQLNQGPSTPSRRKAIFLASVVVILAASIGGYLLYRQSAERARKEAELQQAVLQHAALTAMRQKLEAEIAARQQKAKRDIEFKEVFAQHIDATDRHGSFELFLKFTADRRKKIPDLQQSIRANAWLRDEKLLYISIEGTLLKEMPEHKLAYSGSAIERRCVLDLLNALRAAGIELKLAAANAVWGRQYETHFANASAAGLRFDSLLLPCRQELDALDFKRRNAESELDRVQAARN